MYNATKLVPVKVLKNSARSWIIASEWAGSYLFKVSKKRKVYRVPNTVRIAKSRVLNEVNIDLTELNKQKPQDATFALPDWYCNQRGLMEPYE